MVTTADSRLTLLRRLAWACVLLMLVVTTASAWRSCAPWLVAELRLAQPRPACFDWPACRSADRPVAAAMVPPMLGAPATLALVRGTHRASATLVLLVVIAVAALTLAKPPRRWAAGRLALALLVLALALSVLGIVTPGSRASGVLLGNLLGGLLMLGLSWRLATQLAGWPEASPALRRWARLGAALWMAQAALGALSAAAAAGSAAAPAWVLLHNIGAALGLALMLGLGRRAES